MDNPSHNWTKVAEDCSNQARGALWIKAGGVYYNINNFTSIGVKEFFQNYYGSDKNSDWQVIGKTIHGEQIILKTYKKADRAYAWLGGIMNGRI